MPSPALLCPRPAGAYGAVRGHATHIEEGGLVKREQSAAVIRFRMPAEALQSLAALRRLMPVVTPWPDEVAPTEAEAITAALSHRIRAARLVGMPTVMMDVRPPPLEVELGRHPSGETDRVAATLEVRLSATALTHLALIKDIARDQLGLELGDSEVISDALHFYVAALRHTHAHDATQGPHDELEPAADRRADPGVDRGVESG